MRDVKINEIPVKILGRTDPEAYPIPLFWNHSGVEVNCTGSELWINLEVDCDFYEPWVYVEINGSFFSRQMLLKDTKSLCLYRSMTFGTVKNVRFYRDLQAMEDESLSLLVKGFSTDGEFKEVGERKVKLEFIGDSITSGEGTYGAKEDTDWTSMYMSSSRNYASYIEKALEGEARLISQGGWGVYTGWDNDIRHNLPSIYEKISGVSGGEKNEKLGALKLNDFSLWQPDAVIVNLGTNDNSGFNQPPFEIEGKGSFKLYKNEDGSFCEEDTEKIELAIISFLKMIRRNNPLALIVWTYGMLGNDLTLYIVDAINRYRKETGDLKVHFLTLPDTTGETIGSHGHPGLKAHIQAGKILGEFLAGKLGLEFTEPELN